MSKFRPKSKFLELTASMCALTHTLFVRDGLSRNNVDSHRNSGYFKHRTVASAKPGLSIKGKFNLKRKEG